MNEQDNNKGKIDVGQLTTIDAKKYCEEPFGQTPELFYIYGKHLTPAAKIIYGILRLHRNTQSND